MVANMFIVVLSQVLLLSSLGTGLRLSFAPHPDTVNQLSTDPQRLSCAVHQNPGDNVHITSIVISRSTNDTNGNETVALVTAYAPAHATVDNKTMGVSGDVKPGQPTGEFLSIEWEHPTDAKLGDYYCEVFGLDQVGHPVEFSKPTVIESPELTLKDAIKYIAKLQGEQDKMDSIIEGIKKNCSCLQSDQSDLTQSSPIMKRLEEAERKIVQLQNANSAPSSRTSRHVEMGYFSLCGPNRLQSVSGKFDTSFKSKAKMVVSLHGLETSGSTGSKVEVTPANDGTSYMITCSANSNAFANGTWIAFEES